MAWREAGKSGKKWEVPYLPIDPEDVGREYESDVIRINSQSGKGGIAYILKQNFGMNLPQEMKEEVGYLIKGVSDHMHQELTPMQVYRIFEEHYVNRDPVFHIPECHFKQEKGIGAAVTMEQNGKRVVLETTGNGRLDAVSNAIKRYFGINYELSVYQEHAISRGSSSKAAAYVGIHYGEEMFWGVGVDEDIIKASIKALTSAVNNALETEATRNGKEERIADILKFIQTHYDSVTLDVLSENFNLTKPYLSKYIKVRSGRTFQEIVRGVRMKHACAMLKDTNQTVESIADSVGYESVEHFNRLFKKEYGMTPIQYRSR